MAKPDASVVKKYAHPREHAQSQKAIDRGVRRVKTWEQENSQ